MPEILFKIQILKPTTKLFYSKGLGRYPGICIFNKYHPPSSPQDELVHVIRVHTLRNIGIVGRKICVCFPNLLLINYVTPENLFRFLFLSCRMGMAKKKKSRSKCCSTKNRVLHPPDLIQHFPMDPSLFLLLELITFSFLFKQINCYLAFISFSLWHS